jgi:DNA-binding YbaB/EbfC family protein
LQKEEQMNIQQMMKQAQVMQTKMQELQERLAQTEVEGQAGGGLVTLTMTCKGEMRKLNIKPEIINKDDKETLEDLIMAAINSTRQTADELMATETQAVMKQMGLPAGMKLPGM